MTTVTDPVRRFINMRQRPSDLGKPPGSRGFANDLPLMPLRIAEFDF